VSTLHLGGDLSVGFGKRRLISGDRFNAIAFYLDIADMLAKEGL